MLFNLCVWFLSLGFVAAGCIGFPSVYLPVWHGTAPLGPNHVALSTNLPMDTQAAYRLSVLTEHCNTMSLTLQGNTQEGMGWLEGISGFSV